MKYDIVTHFNRKNYVEAGAAVEDLLKFLAKKKLHDDRALWKRNSLVIYFAANAFVR